MRGTESRQGANGLDRMVMALAAPKTLKLGDILSNACEIDTQRRGGDEIIVCVAQMNISEV